MKGYLTLTQLDSNINELHLDTVETDTPPTLAQLQEVVGGYIEPMFTVESPEGGSRCLTGYVNEEGLLIGLPICGAVHDRFCERPFAGNMVIVGLDDDTGETVSLTLRELKFVRMAWSFEMQTLRLV